MEKLKIFLTKILKPYPDLYLFIKSVYKNKKINSFYKLVCYSKGKAHLEFDKYITYDSNQLLIKNYYTSLNSGTERASFYNLENSKLSFPYNPQASGVGKVFKRGFNNFFKYKKGDLVFGPLSHSQFSVKDSNQVVKLDERIDLTEASFFHLAIIALQGIKMLDIKNDYEGEIVVIGQGVIGRITTLILRAINYRVVCVTRSDNKSKFLNEKNLIIIQNNGLDKLNKIHPKYIIDATGNNETINIIMDSISKNGKIVLLGSNRGFTKNFKINNSFRLNKVSVIGAHIKNINHTNNYNDKSYLNDANFIQNLVLEKKLSFKSLISKKIDSHELEKKYLELLDSKENIGSLIDWTKFNLKKINKKNIDVDFEIKASSKKYGVALIGCGDIGVVNANAVLNSNSCKLKLVIDKNIIEAKKLSKKFNVDFSTDYESLINRDDINIVIVAVPHYLHYPICIDIIKRFNKNIIVEKPIALNTSEAKKMIDTAIKNKILLRTFYPFIYENQILIAKRLFESGIVGEMHGFSLAFHRFRPKHYWTDKDNNLSWRGIKKYSGGGFLLMYLVHGINNLKHITGTRITEVNSFTANLFHNIEVEDTAVINFKCSDEALGSLTTSSAVIGSGASLMRIWGDCGQILINEDRVSFYSNKKIEKYKSKRWNEVKTKLHKKNTRSIFLDQYTHDLEKNIQTCKNESGYESIKIIESVYKSSENNKSVKIN